MMKPAITCVGFLFFAGFSYQPCLAGNSRSSPTSSVVETSTSFCPNVIRGKDGGLWGLDTRSQNFSTPVYYSGDDGKTWDFVGNVPCYQPKDFIIKNADEIFTWDKAGNNVIFNRGTGQSKPCPGLGQMDLAGVLEAPEGWVAYGGLKAEKGDSYTFHDTPYGFVMLSTDQGATWKKVEEWKERGVAKLFEAKNGDIYLLSYLGYIRKLQKTTTGYMEIDVSPAPGDKGSPSLKTLYAHFVEPEVFYFENSLKGYITGGTYQNGEDCFTTSDGGATWSRMDYSKFPFWEVRQVGSRTVCLQYDSNHDYFSGVCLIQNGKRKPIFKGRYAKKNGIRIEGIGVVDDRWVLVVYTNGYVDDSGDFIAGDRNYLKSLDIKKFPDL